MAVLRNDIFKRGQSVTRKPFTFNAVHLVFIVIAAGLLLLARLEHPFAVSFQRSLDVWGARPINWAHDMIVPAGVVWERGRLALAGDLEIVRLRQENLRLRVAEKRALQDRTRMQEAQRAAELVGNNAKAPLLTARVLSGANGTFGHSLLIDAGCRNGIDADYSVQSSGRLIGRIVDVTDDTARVLLLSHPQSRTTVVVGNRMHPAILIGTGREFLILESSLTDAQIQDGDLVLTSGEDGVFSSGLRIGRVRKTPNGLRVQLAAHSQKIRYVAIERGIGPAAQTKTRDAAQSAEHAEGKESLRRRCTTPPGDLKLRQPAERAGPQ